MMHRVSDADGIRVFPFDPLADDPPLPPPPPGQVILLLDGAAPPWNVAAVERVLAAWAEQGRAVWIDTTDATGPGLADYLAGRLPLNACLRPVPGRRYFRLTLGVLAAGWETVFHDPRWVRLLQGLRQAQARVLLRAAPDPALVAAVRGWADAAWLLGDMERLRPALAALGAVPIAARLIPVGREAPAPAASTPAAEVPPQPAPPAAPVGPEPRAPQASRPPTPQPASVTSPAAPSSGGEPQRAAPPSAPRPTPARVTAARPAPRKTPPPPRRRSPETLVAAAVAGALLLGAAGWFALRRAEPRPTPAVAATVTGTPVGVPLPFSVRLRIFPSRSEAEAEIARLRQEAVLRDVPLYVSVERVEDVLYYRVLAGFFADTAAARRLRDRLLREGLVEPDPSGPMALIETVPMAFEVGRFATLADAERQMELWQARGIPTYAVPVPYVDGAERWHVYAGAYRDEIESRALRSLLERAGLPAKLVARVGRAS